MPEWTPELLLIVFATHLPFFLWRYRRTREIRYGATSLTFALLVATYGLRVFAPAWSIRGVPFHEAFRSVALLSAVVSVGMLIQHHVRRRLGTRAPGVEG